MLAAGVALGGGLAGRLVVDCAGVFGGGAGSVSGGVALLGKATTCQFTFSNDFLGRRR